jgi:hypothetical protein
MLYASRNRTSVASNSASILFNCFVGIWSNCCKTMIHELRCILSSFLAGLISFPPWYLCCCRRGENVI